MQRCKMHSILFYGLYMYVCGSVRRYCPPLRLLLPPRRRQSRGADPPRAHRDMVSVLLLLILLST